MNERELTKPQQVDSFDSFNKLHREAIQYQLLPVNLHNLLHQTLCSGISTVGTKVLGYKLSLFLSLSKPLYLRWVLWLVKHQSLKEKKKVQFDKESCISGTTNHCFSQLQRSQSKKPHQTCFQILSDMIRTLVIKFQFDHFRQSNLVVARLQH